MSGIYGLIHLDGAPARPEELEAMRSDMREWGLDAGGTWLEGPAGLGNLILFDTPEAVHERGLHVSPQGFSFAAEARLDARAELCAALGIQASQGTSIADGELCLRAYEKWGASAPDHLLGDWSFAAWHPAERRLFLARDHLGNTSLYYCHDERRFAFASSRKALYALGIPRRLNEFYLASMLVSWSVYYGPQTIELDLKRLPPAHSLTVTAGKAVMDQYWRLEDTPELHRSTQQDYVEGLSSAYDQAIRDRLRSHGDIGVALSGGLDSGSTAALASRALGAAGRRLRAYTSAPVHDVSHADAARRVGDEAPLAQSLADFAGNMDLVEIRVQGVTPIQGMRRGLQIHGEPAHAASNSYWLHELLAAARRDGIGTLLTGQGGNGTISWTGKNRARLLRLLLKGRFWSRALQVMLYPLLPQPWLAGLRRIAHPRGLDWSRTAINPDFASRVHLSEQHFQHSGDTTMTAEWYPARRHRYAMIRPGASITGAFWAENAAAHSLSIRDATLDKRVMEYAIAVPDRAYFGPDGYDRWLIREAMHGLMPDSVRLNRRIGLQAGDLCQRLSDSAAEVESTLNAMQKSELAANCISLPRLRQVWRLVQEDPTFLTTHEAITVLARGLMAGIFLMEWQERG